MVATSSPRSAALTSRSSRYRIAGIVLKTSRNGWATPLSPTAFILGGTPRLQTTSWLGRPISDRYGIRSRSSRFWPLGGAGIWSSPERSAEYAPSSRALTEDDPVQPWSVYGAAKAALCTLLASSWRPAGLAVAWARLFNVTGPGESPERLLPTVARSILTGDAIDLSPGDQVRDFLDVRDVASALVALSSAPVPTAPST